MSLLYDIVASASDPGKLPFSEEYFRIMYPEYYRWFFRKRIPDHENLEYAIHRMTNHLVYGDSRAAVVISKNPILVSAYSVDFDCVAILRFPKRKLTKELNVGDRLLSINTYSNLPNVVSDLFPGKGNSGSWQNFSPMIADFFSANHLRIAELKSKINADEWARTREMGEQYHAERPSYVRDGCPLNANIPGTPMELVPQAIPLSGPPNFVATRSALERLKEFFAELNLSFGSAAVLLVAKGTHPELREQELDVKHIHQVPKKDFFHIQVDFCTFAVHKEHAHVFENAVLGFDRVRSGFTFRVKD